MSPKSFLTVRLKGYTYFLPLFSFDKIRDVSFEVIVIDDASPDGTQDIVKQLQKLYGDNRIVCSHHT